LHNYYNYFNDRDNFEAEKIIVALNEKFDFSDSPNSSIFYSDILTGIDYEKAEVICHSKKNKSNIGNIILIHLKNKEKSAVIDSIDKLSVNSAVTYAEPNYLYSIHRHPNDPYYGDLWGLEKIKTPLSWNYSVGNADVVVGVTDSGVDNNHPDIKNNMWISANGQYGWDFIHNNGNSMDTLGHGTHVSGTISAVGNNLTGITGVCWNVKIAALKIGHISISLAAAIAAIDYAGINNIPILNASWGGRYYSPDLKFAIEQYDGLFIASAGNNGSDNDLFPIYPSSYDSSNIISVAASNPDDTLADFSNYGAKSVDIAAPGAKILSLSLRDEYVYKNGTSMAAPHVAGAAALLKSYMPDLTILDIKDIILSSADKHPNLIGRVSSGMLNVKAMFDKTKSVPLKS